MCNILPDCLETLPGDGTSHVTAYAGWETVPSPDGLVCVVMLIRFKGDVEPEEVTTCVEVSVATAAETPVDGFVQKLTGGGDFHLWQMDREAGRERFLLSDSGREDWRRAFCFWPRTRVWPVTSTLSMQTTCVLCNLGEWRLTTYLGNDDGFASLHLLL